MIRYPRTWLKFFLYRLNLEILAQIWSYNTLPYQVQSIKLQDSKVPKGVFCVCHAHNNYNKSFFESISTCVATWSIYEGNVHGQLHLKANIRLVGINVFRLNYNLVHLILIWKKTTIFNDLHQRIVKDYDYSISYPCPQKILPLVQQKKMILHFVFTKQLLAVNFVQYLLP